MAYTDDFTDTNFTDLPVHNANWVTPPGGSTCEIDNNSMVGSAATNTIFCNYWNATFADAHYSKGVISASTGQHGVAVRIQTGANSLFYCIWNGFLGTNLVFPGQCIAGTPTDWDSGIAGFTANDVLEFAIDPTVSTTFYVKKNGTTVATYTGKNALTGGKAGVAAYQRQSNIGLLSWEGDNVSLVIPGRRIYVT